MVEGDVAVQEDTHLQWFADALALRLRDLRVRGRDLPPAARDFVSRSLDALETAEEQLHRASAELRVRAARLDELERTLAHREAHPVIGTRKHSRKLAAFSHEIRTPIGAILGYCELLLDDIPAPLPEACRAHVESIRGCAAHQIELVESLSAHGKSGTETDGGADSHEITLETLVHQVRGVVEGLARQKGLGFVVMLPPRPLPFHADPGRLRQILINVLHNAVKYTDAGVVSLVVENAGSDVVFRVTDTGCGMDAADLPHIFERYWRGADARHDHDGTGLGLAVVRQLVDRLEGNVAVESTLGRGTTVTIRLPLAVARPDGVDEVGIRSTRPGVARTPRTPAPTSAAPDPRA